MSGLWRVGRREQASLETGVVKLLERLKKLSLEGRRREESINTHRAVNAPDLVIVGAISKKQLLVALKKTGVSATIIPNEDAPPTGLQNARKLAPRLITIKPVSSLAGGDEVYTVISQCSCFGGAVQAGEIWIVREQAFASLAHFGVRFHPKDVVPICEKNAGKKTGARGDVRDDAFRGQPTFAFQEIDDLERIAGAIADVAFDTRRKAPGSIQNSHATSLA